MFFRKSRLVRRSTFPILVRKEHVCDFGLTSNVDALVIIRKCFRVGQNC